VDRRQFLATAITAGAWSFLPREVRAQEDLDFQRIFAEIKKDPAAIGDAVKYRDFAMANNGAACIPVTTDGVTTCIVSAARQPPRIPPSHLKISDDSRDFIVFYEVTSASNYNKTLTSPTWPGNDSGITVGIGYDLGYASEIDVKNEWGNYVHPFVINRLISVCGKKGGDAEASLPSVSNIRIDWDSAYRQFTEMLLPIFVAQTETFCKNMDSIHEDCRGALTSLIFNRGTALELKNDPIDSRKEMREIKELMAKKQYADIPQKFLDMRRIWQGKPKARGLLTRRAGEAALFARGLKS